MGNTHDVKVCCVYRLIDWLWPTAASTLAIGLVFLFGYDLSDRSIVFFYPFYNVKKTFHRLIGRVLRCVAMFILGASQFNCGRGSDRSTRTKKQALLRHGSRWRRMPRRRQATGEVLAENIDGY